MMVQSGVGVGGPNELTRRNGVLPCNPSDAVPKSRWPADLTTATLTAAEERRILSSQLCKSPLPTEPVTWEGVAARLLGKWSAREEREAAGVACLSAR